MARQQEARTPDGVARRLLSIAERHPEVLIEAAALSVKGAA
jgi:hypothetical protein